MNPKRTTVILPSIRVPQNINAWANMLHADTDTIIVAGNVASPHREITQALDEVTVRTGVYTEYLHPDSDVVVKTAIHDFIPPNSTTRRNFALLRALAQRPDVLVTIDDDNFPYVDTWLLGVKTLLSGEGHHRPVLRSESGWWNAGNLCDPKVVHRGYPRTHWTSVDDSQLIAKIDDRYAKIGVVASLWYGDPDINAVERMFSDPEVRNVKGSCVLEVGTWCPFDSQSTAVHGDIAHMMFMWPGVGRYDDIWSSYLMRAVMDVTGWFITYGTPSVRQDRNPHNLIKDLREELYGYEYTEEFTDLLRVLVNEAVKLGFDKSGLLGGSGYASVFEWFMHQVAKRFVHLPEFTRDSFLAWLSDLEVLRRG